MTDGRARPGRLNRSGSAGSSLPAEEGFTLVETVVSASLLCLILAIIYTLCIGAASSTGGSVEASDALRSVVIAVERLRQDAGLLIFQLPDKDLVCDSQRQFLSMSVADSPLGEELLKNSCHPVTYTLRPLASAPGGSGVGQLMRDDGRGPRPVGGCLLREFRPRYCPPGAVSPLQGYLEITLTGAGSASGRHTYTECALFPVTRVIPPAYDPLARRIR